MLLREVVAMIDGLTMEELDTIAQAVEDRREGLMESLACEVAAKTEEVKFFQQELEDMRIEYLGAKAISDRIKLNTQQPVKEEQLDTSCRNITEVCHG